MFDIKFSRTALSKLKKYDSILQKRILKSLERIRIRPWKFVKKIVGSNYFKLRVGKYRVILDVKKNELIILMIAIDHRKKAYKK